MHPEKVTKEAVGQQEGAVSHPLMFLVLQVLSICPKDMRADICVHLNRKVCSYFHISIHQFCYNA